MNGFPLILAMALVGTASQASQEPIGLSVGTKPRAASLLPGLGPETGRLPSLTLAGGLRFDHSAGALPLDHGGGVDSDTKQVLALIMGLLIGFGTGHLVAHHREDFVLFLVIDAVIVAVIIVGSAAVHSGVMVALAVIALVASHIIQGLDAYHAAGGQKIIERTREKAILLADRIEPTTPTAVSRQLKLSF